MLRTMVFVDHMNFNKATQSLYGTIPPRVDYNKLPKEIARRAYADSDFVKCFLFVPRPDDFLMQIGFFEKYYKWVDATLKALDFIDVIEGRSVARPTSDNPMNPTDKSTYIAVEKGTDINLATSLLSMAYHNSFDVAVVVTGDSDYALLFEQVRRMGKIIILASVKNQNISKLDCYIDKSIVLDEDFFNACLLQERVGNGSVFSKLG